jgi:hypothetical protein
VIVDRINLEPLFLIWNKGAIVLAQAGLAAYVMFLLLYLHKSVTVRVVFL